MDVIFIALLIVALVFMCIESWKLHKEGKQLEKTLHNWRTYGLPYNPNETTTHVSIVETDYDALLKEAKSIQKR